MATYGVFSYDLNIAHTRSERSPVLRERSLEKLFGHLLSDLCKIKIPIISKHKGRKGDEEFSQRGVNVHEIPCLDVSRRELAKVDFIESVM